MKKVTLETIGNELNISKVAVFKALNDKPGISEELRQRVKQKAGEMGYSYTPVQDKEQLKFLFLINKDIFLTTCEQFYTPIYYYLNEEMENFNYQLSITFFDQTADPLHSLKIRLQQESFAGLFIAGEVNQSILKELAELKIPIVFIDFYSPLFNYTYVYSDNFHLSYLATKYLLDRGHTQIGFVGNINATSSICDRYLGFRKALIENNIEFNPVWHIPVNIEHPFESHEQLLPQNLPTAFICHCDGAAHKLYMLLKIRGLSVPENISVISFDNTDLSENISPPLTSIGTNKTTIARKSFNSMLDVLNNKKSNCILKATLTERQSVKTILPT